MRRRCGCGEWAIAEVMDSNGAMIDLCATHTRFWVGERQRFELYQAILVLAESREADDHTGDMAALDDRYFDEWCGGHPRAIRSDP